MDERYYLRDTQGRNVSEVTRHNISVSLIKDFEDMVSNQTLMPYDLYQMRYVAFMNKVHELEYLMGGLEISCYNMLPIAERGLPFASPETIQRTNCCDLNSLKYIKDRIKDKILSTNDVSYYMKAIAKSVISRIDGYDVEYRTYQYTGCSEEACFVVRNKNCEELYKDVVEIEWLKKIPLTVSTYKALLNEPKGSVYNMTEFERQKLRRFKRGYLDFLVKNMKENKSVLFRKKCEYAYNIVQKKFFGK